MRSSSSDGSVAALSPRVLLAALVLAASTAAAQSPERPGVPAQDAWTCPLTHPIKGNFTTYSEERCIYHMGGGQFYGKTKAERCYVSMQR